MIYGQICTFLMLITLKKEYKMCVFYSQMLNRLKSHMAFLSISITGYRLNKRQFTVLKSVNYRFSIFYTRHNIRERFSHDVLSWEHYGVNASNPQNISTDYQCITKLVLAQAWRRCKSTHKNRLPQIFLLKIWRSRKIVELKMFVTMQ